MLLQRFKESDAAYQHIVEADNGHLRLLQFGLLTLAPNEQYRGETGGLETVLVLIRGDANIRVDDTSFPGLHRTDVFGERATAVYAPISSTYEVRNVGETMLEVAVCMTPSTTSFAPFVVRPDEVQVKTVGQDNWQREVHDIVVKNADGRVHRIIVGETFNPPGNWSSYPPHKHDSYIPGVEACMEEVYHYRTSPENGFGVQSIYTSNHEVDDVFTVRNRDTFLIPNGYHPVCAAAGYQLYYLWVMAGEIDRVMIPNDDPAHAWVRHGK